MANHDEQIEFINNVDQQYKFMDENDLDRMRISLINKYIMEILTAY